MKRFIAALSAGVFLVPSIAQAQDTSDAASVKIVAPPPAPMVKGPDDPLSLTPEDTKQYGSLYLRCDGRPNNITDAESFARLLGAITLLGLFAPTPEAPDPSKRLFGERGVAACSKLLDDPKEETNGLRRLPLILARAIHHIETKDYDAALADTGKAQAESEALGLADNPYFERSLGLSIDLLRSRALFMKGDAEGARKAGLADMTAMPFTLYAGLASSSYAPFNRSMSEEEDRYLQTMQHLTGVWGAAYAARLEEVGRFSEAARIRDDVIVTFEKLSTQDKDTGPLIHAAIAHGLAGDWAGAQGLADRAQRNFDERRAAGKPENDSTTLIEALDFFGILKMIHEGKLDEARRNFAARSRWLAPSFGAMLKVNAMLREGAGPEQLFGALEATPDELWAKREADQRAIILEVNANNRTLFSFILPYASIKDYEAQSKQVWRADKSRIISKEVMKDSEYFRMWIDADSLTQPESLLLHAALLAKHKGYTGFNFIMLPNQPSIAFVRFVNADDGEAIASNYLDADTVIANLRQVIPSPAELAARRRT